MIPTAMLREKLSDRSLLFESVLVFSLMMDLRCYIKGYTVKSWNIKLLLIQDASKPFNPILQNKTCVINKH